MIIATNVLLIVTAVALIAFLALYLCRSPWWQSLQGIVLVVKTTGMLLLAGWFLFDEFVGRADPIWKLVILGLVAAAYTANVIALLLAQGARRPVRKRIGQGIVPPADIERTGP